MVSSGGGGGRRSRLLHRQKGWREEGMSAQPVATQQQELGWSSASEHEKSQACGRESAGAGVYIQLCRRRVKGHKPEGAAVL